MDWGIGEYEFIAPQLEPAADVVIAAAKLQPGERVLDLGCGTGNAALRAAAQGARVTGVDPSSRLRDLAATRAADAGLDITLLDGEAAAIPVDDGSVDALLSVFGVIFAPDPQAAAAEMARVLVADGRIVMTAWKPTGPLAAVGRLMGQTVRAELGITEEPPAPFPWHDPERVGQLFAPHDLTATVDTQQIAFSAESAKAYVENETTHHPRSVEILSTIGDEAHRRLTHELTALLTAQNEDPAAFRVTSEYVVIAARRA